MADNNSFEDIIKKLEASKTVVNMAVERGVKKAGLLIEGDAKRLVPVDTGRLRGSINTHVRWEGKQCIANVGTNVEYAPYMEFGTGQRGDKTAEGVNYRQDWKGIPPQPFLRPAFRFNVDSGNVKKVITNEVKKTFK